MLSRKRCHRCVESKLDLMPQADCDWDYLPFLNHFASNARGLATRIVKRHEPPYPIDIRLLCADTKKASEVGLARAWLLCQKRRRLAGMLPKRNFQFSLLSNVSSEGKT